MAVGCLVEGLLKIAAAVVPGPATLTHLPVRKARSMAPSLARMKPAEVPATPYINVRINLTYRWEPRY